MVANGNQKSPPIRAEPNEPQVGEIFAEEKGLVSFGSKLLLAKAPARS